MKVHYFRLTIQIFHHESCSGFFEEFYYMKTEYKIDLSTVSNKKGICKETKNGKILSQTCYLMKTQEN